ncbi:hypothetical protein DOJK_01249 [Patescibacteria group bacterium]|nr:hypothetical protein DOJK_01249 [Patescibacteria group bacterium]
MLRQFIFLTILIPLIFFSQLANSKGKSFTLESDDQDKLSRETINRGLKIGEQENRFADKQNQKIHEEIEEEHQCHRNNDICWRIVEEKGDKVVIECLDGRQKGFEHKLSMEKDVTRKNRTFEEAAREECTY